MTDSIIRAAVDHCWQQEQWAHAEFYHGMEEYQRRDLAAATGYPWRGIMSPSILRLIEHLEGAGHYDASKLINPTSLAKNVSPYQNSPYDYPTARRVEADKAERKWAQPGNKDG